MHSTPAVQIHHSDNVAAALQHLPAGTTVRVGAARVTLSENIPQKHKFALRDLKKDASVRMYGVVVGKAIRDIPCGALIEVGNVVHAASGYAGRRAHPKWGPPDDSNWRSRTFAGYRRNDGRVGTANHWLIIPLVFCENRNLAVLKAALAEPLGYGSAQSHTLDISALIEGIRNGADADRILATDISRSPESLRKSRVFPNVDGIKFLSHDGGCGGTRQDAETLCALLAGYVTHPNVAGATILSLGCQHAQARVLRKAIAQRDPDFDKPLFVLEQRESTSEPAFLADAVKLTFTGLMQADAIERKSAPLSKLVLGVECGGSDGFSGISANPALGHTSDLLVACGGTVLLSEFPELHGVEQELIDRCVDDAVAARFAELMEAYGARAAAVGSGFEMNPSPGNIRDGLITDAMKSAGAARKGGTSPITAVLDYTEPAVAAGLNLLCTPGNDVESTTGLAGSGANLIVFTTGLGTPTGNPVAPVVKLASNTPLFQRMRDIIDLDAGGILDGSATIAEKGEEILEFLLAVASGEAEPAAVRLGQDDFIPWKRGISL